MTRPCTLLILWRRFVRSATKTYIMHLEQRVTDLKRNLDEAYGMLDRSVAVARDDVLSERQRANALAECLARETAARKSISNRYDEARCRVEVLEALLGDDN